MAKKRSLPLPSTHVSKNHFNWDSVRPDADNRPSTADVTVHSDQSKSPNPSKTDYMGEVEESLGLKLGCSIPDLTSFAEPVSRPNKRVRSCSPGAANYPTWHMNDCKEDLSNAEGYHQCLKVCKLHRKATKALVWKQMQRFCQRCRRFQPLSEFDEVKQCCRLRLAGHIRHRRKTQSEDFASRVLLHGNHESTYKTDLDVEDFLAVLARVQGSFKETGEEIKIKLKLASDTKYLSSISSNPSANKTPLSLAPVAQKLVPVQTSREKIILGNASTHPLGNVNVTEIRATGSIVPLQLSGGTSTGTGIGSNHSSLCQAGYMSLSWSHHSFTMLHSDARNCTGQIIFVSVKDPSRLHGTLRTQIHNWLANSQSEMESYIRPGCIALSVYIPKSSFLRDKLEEKLYQCVKSLVEDIDSDLWRNGRFLVDTLKQLVSYKEGKICLCKSWNLWNSPELVTNSPVAGVSGEETSLVLRGRNLTIFGTKITCTHVAGYTIEQISGPACQQSLYDETNWGSFRIFGAHHPALGFCFFELNVAEEGTTVLEDEHQASMLSYAKCVENVVPGFVDDSLSTKSDTDINLVKIVPLGYEDVANHDVEHGSPKLLDAKCMKDVASCFSDDARSKNIESELTLYKGVTGGHEMTSCAANEAGLEMESSLGKEESEEKAHNIQGEVGYSEEAVKYSSCFGFREMHCDSAATLSVDSSVVDLEGASNSILEVPDVKQADDRLKDADRSREPNSISQDTGAIVESHHDTASPPACSTALAMAGRDLGEAIIRPFNFLIKVPKFDDEKLREQIRHAQLQVDVKTQHRDAFRLQIQNKRSNLQRFGVEYDAAILEEKDVRRLVKAKRLDIESVQTLISRMKNAIFVEDIDARIYIMEHMMQHETLQLEEKRQYTREIMLLKQHREHLSSNIGNQDEIQQALDKKSQIEDRFKVLKKELEGLKNKVFKAQVAAETARKKYENENRKIKELQNQFKAANNVRQAAYAQMQSLKRQMYEKNKLFWMYKDDSATASDYAMSRNKDALHSLCINQVEAIMELWNNNDEFRKKYVSCNLMSTVRRLGTLDGRSLGPDEEPPIVPNYAIERFDRSTSNPVKTSSMIQTTQEKKSEAITVSIFEAVDRHMEKVVGSEKHTIKMQEPEKPALDNGLPSFPCTDMCKGVRGVHLQTKEELELARLTEEIGKDVETTKSKEQRRLEEIAKAKEALERKRRIAEKAQMRAELRAQKEAEQREKERERRLRKKERKKAGAGELQEGSNDDEIEQTLESAIETVKEPAEVKEISPTVAKRSRKPSQFVKQSKSKAIPPPLRNRNNRKMQQWMWVIFTSVLVIALFLLGNIGVLYNLKPRKAGF